MRPPEAPTPHGILNLDKPSGPTSHDCVARVRRAMRTRRVGHAGTLDPLASGVLVIGLGNGTRILEYLQGLPKTYRARIAFGLETDSYDTTGKTLEERDASGITEEQVRSELLSFRGVQMQVPPMVSALKVGGERLYDLARRGETVEREARPVTFYNLELLSFTPGQKAEAEVRVVCSVGTYVRSLCHDLGGRLETGAAMSALVREAVGEFRVEDAVPLDRVNESTPLLPLSTALAHLPEALVNAAGARRLAQGQFIPAPDGVPDGPVRVVSEEGELLAVATARGRGEARLLSPEKVFAGADAARLRS